jgi:hypothetical protein
MPKVVKYKIEDGITQSLLQNFLCCPTRSAFALKGLYDPTQIDKYTKGRIGHELLDTLYATQDLKLTMDRLDFLYENFPDSDKKNQIFGIFDALIRCYWKFYAKDFKGIKYKPEGIFDLTWLGYRLRGKTDLTFEAKAGSVLMEHKFWSQINEDKLVYVLSLDFQTNFYAFIQKLLTKKYPNRIDYNVIRTPQNKIKDGETSKDFSERMVEIINKDPKYYFIRKTIVPSKMAQLKFEADLKIILYNFRMAVANDTDYMNLTSCITGPYLCEYSSLCVSGTTAGYKIKPLFEELK